MRTLTLLFLASALCAVMGCGGATGSVTTVNGVFTGTTSDTAENIVLLFDSPSSGSSRTFHAYASDGATVSEFFSGTIDGNIYDVLNSNGEVSGTVDSFSAQGSLLIGSTSVGYTATKTSNVGGLYSVTVDMTGGTITGFSTTGSHVDGTIGTTAIGSDFQVTGTFTPSGGSPVPFSALISDDSDGQQFWVVSPDLTIRGGPNGNSGSGFVTTES